MVEKFSIALYIVSIILFLTAFGVFLSRFTSDKDTSSIGNKILIIGLAVLTVALVTRIVIVGSMAFQPYEVLAAVTWFLVFEALIVEYWSGVKIIGFYISPVATIMLLVGLSQYNKSAEAPTVSYWILTHAALIFVSYGAFIIAAGSSLLYLLQEKQLKGRKSTKLLNYLPSLNLLEETSFRSAAIGFIVLTVALGMGLSSAFNEWKAWDITIVMASFFTWLVFLFYLFSRIKLGWLGKKSAYVSMFGSMVIFLTLIVNYLVNTHVFPGG